MSRRHLRQQILGILTVLLLLLAACGSDDESSDSSAGGDSDSGGVIAPAEEDPTEVPTEAPEETPEEPPADDPAETPEDTPDEPEPVVLTASHRGVTETEIKLGVAIIDPEQILELFGVDLGVFSVPNLYEAMTDEVNLAGGINGRTVSAHISSFLPVGPADSERVCTELMEDEKVFMVIGQFLEDNALCITETHESVYVGHFGENPDRQERSSGRLFATEMEQTRQRVGGVTEMVAAGDFDGFSVAIYYEADPDEAYADAVRPLLDDAGVEVVGTYSAGAATQDTVADDATTDTVAQRMQADGATLILNVSGIGRIIESVQRIGWEVPIAMTNGQAADRLDLRDDLSLDDAVLERTFAVTTDKPTRDAALADPGVQGCIAAYDERFPDEPFDLTDDDIVNGIVNHCRAFAMVVLMLEAAGPELTPDTVVAGAEGLGTFDLPAMLGATLAPDKHSAGANVRRYVYDASVGYWVPVGDPIPT